MQETHGTDLCSYFLAGISDFYSIDCLEFCWEYRLALGSSVSLSPLVAVGHLRIWPNEGEKAGCFSLSQKRIYFDGCSK